MIITFIDDNRGTHGVESICDVFPIAPSTYHEHVAERRDPVRLSLRAQREMTLKPEVARVPGRAGTWSGPRGFRDLLFRRIAAFAMDANARAVPRFQDSEPVTEECS